MSNLPPLPADSTPESLFRNGIIDVRKLENVSPEWMLARLKGQDPYLPIDRDNLELPHRILVDCWLEADSTSHLRESIGRASAQLLNLAWDSGPEDWVKWLLRLVATIQPASCLRLLTSIAKHQHFSRGTLESGLDRLWLEAVAAFDPQPSSLIPIWKSLLQGSQRYNAIAYSALSHSIDLAIFYLPEYYSGVPENDRQLLVQEAIRDILNHGTDYALKKLQWYRPKLERAPGLEAAVDAALDGLKEPFAFFGPNGHEKYRDIALKEAA